MIESFEERWKEASGAAAPAALISHARRFYSEFTRDRPRLGDLRDALVDLLTYVTTEEGRTEANCRAVDAFVCILTAERSDLLERLPPAYQELIDRVSLDLYESVRAPDRSEGYETTPEEMLARARALEARPH